MRIKVMIFLIALLLSTELTGKAGQGSMFPSFTNPTAVTNPYLPLALLKQDILEGIVDGKLMRVERSFRAGTKVFRVGDQMVETVIIEDRDFIDGKLREVTLDYFAQGDDGVVYYFGEDVDVYNKKGKIIGHEGAWLFGVNTNQLGKIVPANPKVGDRFQAENVPGITREDDEVVGMDVLAPGGTILSVTEQGYGKRTDLEEYRVQSRGGIGIINIQTSERNGKVIGVAQVSNDDELMLITQQGKILRMAANTIRAIGRATQGVRLIDIEGDDRAVSIARLEEQDEETKGDEPVGDVTPEAAPSEENGSEGPSEE